MPIANLSEMSPDAAVSAQTCVIGAGIAGLFLARRLAMNGHKVVVVESGLANVDIATQELNRIDDRFGRYTRALTGRFRALGGTSTRWGGRLIPISEHEFGDRPYLSQRGWPFPRHELDKYLPEIEKVFKVEDSAYEDDLLNVVDRLKRFPRGDRDIVSRWAKCPTFRRCNLATTLKRDLHRLPKLQVWLGATVCGFDLDRERGRLRSIEARHPNGRRLTVRADRFVIATGTIEATRLLQWIDALSDGHAFARCNVLGRYFQDHLKVTIAKVARNNIVRSNEAFGYRFIGSTMRELRMTLSEKAQRDDKIASTYGLITLDMDESPLALIKDIVQGRQRREIDLGALLKLSASVPYLARSAYWRYWRQQLFLPGSVQLKLQIWAEQRQMWTNRIALSLDRDAFEMPKVRLEWRPTDADERTFQKMTARLKSYWQRAAFDRDFPLVWPTINMDRTSSLIDSAEACAHPSGSTRMGDHEAESVVDADLQCHMIRNVSVASASVFPSSGSANPTLTLMQLALRLADYILKADLVGARP